MNSVSRTRRREGKSRGIGTSAGVRAHDVEGIHRSILTKRQVERGECNTKGRERQGQKARERGWRSRSGSRNPLYGGKGERVNGKTHRTAEILSELAAQATNHGFVTELIYDDRIPDERRSRRRTKTTKFERILVMRKVG